MALKDRTTLKASADSLLANNTSAAVSPEDVRETIKDLADSTVFYNENTQKANVRVATTANGTLATAFENGDTVDGVTLATGDRILLKDQSTASQNGIYTVNASGAPTRATDFNSSDNVILGSLVYVTAGTVNAGKYYYLSSPTGTITVGTSSLVFSVLIAAGVTHNNTSTFNKVSIKVVEIGDWNMDSTTSVGVLHGISSGMSKIRSVTAAIRTDAATLVVPINRGTSVTDSLQVGYVQSWDDTTVTLDRETGGYFDNTSFDSTSFNRGWLTIIYEDTV